jgi:hypothetical protein
MRARTASQGVLFTIILATGCGGGSKAILASDGGGGDKAIPLAELPPKLAQAMCTVYQNCFGDVFALFLNGVDCVAWSTEQVNNGTFPLLAGAIAQGTVFYNGAKAQACLDSLSARTCAQMLDRDSPECLAALDGTVPLGGACDLDEECVGKALCKSSSGICPGQCSPLQVAGQGCAKDSDCQDGLVCSKETQLCVAPATDGQECEYGAPPCRPGLLCLGKNDDNKTPGTCRTSASALSGSEGEACDPASGQLCRSGLSCVANSLTLSPLAINWLCVQSGGYAAGDPCKPGFPEACASGNYCMTASGQLTGTCTAIPSSGQACGSGTSKCQPNAACVEGTCQNLVANGVGCAGDAMCWSEKCGTSGGCEAKVPCK